MTLPIPLTFPPPRPEPVRFPPARTLELRIASLAFLAALGCEQRTNAWGYMIRWALHLDDNLVGARERTNILFLARARRRSYIDQRHDEEHDELVDAIRERQDPVNRARLLHHGSASQIHHGATGRPQQTPGLAFRPSERCCVGRPGPGIEVQVAKRRPSVPHLATSASSSTSISLFITQREYYHGRVVDGVDGMPDIYAARRRLD